MQMIDFNSFSNFWMLITKDNLVEDASNYFKNFNVVKNNIFKNFNFIQPVFKNDELISDKAFGKILHFKCKNTNITFRGNAHLLGTKSLIIAWPFLSNLKEISQHQLGHLMEHPACIMTDFLILKDVLSKQQEKIKKLEIEKLENQILEQQKINQHQSKLATIGEIASGVGHEISNPLTIASLNNAMILKKMKDGEISYDEIRSRLEKQTAVYERMSKILMGLKTFTRIDDEQEEIFCIQKEVKTIFEMLFEIFKNNSIELKYEYDQDDIYIQAGKGLFHQTVMNLISNARDAVKNKPHPEIQVSIKKLSQNKASVSVKDNGEGISEENKVRILRPFFTTKASGEGTGIGMTIVQNFVHKSNAELLIDSSVGQGSTFTIIFDLHHRK